MASQYLINLLTNMYFVLEWLLQKAEPEAKASLITGVG